MLAGVLMLLFIGFNRLWHFTYVRLDSLMCGFFHLNRLPAASTYWRYVDSLGINQANSLVNLMSGLRRRIWETAANRQLSISRCLDWVLRVTSVKWENYAQARRLGERGSAIDC